MFPNLAFFIPKNNAGFGYDVNRHIRQSSVLAFHNWRQLVVKIMYYSSSSTFLGYYWRCPHWYFGMQILVVPLRLMEKWKLKEQLQQARKQCARTPWSFRCSHRILPQQVTSLSPSTFLAQLISSSSLVLLRLMGFSRALWRRRYNPRVFSSERSNLVEVDSTG